MTVIVLLIKSFLILFLPGFIIVEATFGRKLNKKDNLDAVEIFLLSCAISLTVMTIVVYCLDKIGIKSASNDIFYETLSIILVLLLGRLFVKIFSKKIGRL